MELPKVKKYRNFRNKFLNRRFYRQSFKIRSLLFRSYVEFIILSFGAITSFQILEFLAWFTLFSLILFELPVYVSLHHPAKRKEYETFLSKNPTLHSTALENPTLDIIPLEDSSSIHSSLEKNTLNQYLNSPIIGQNPTFPFPHFEDNGLVEEHKYLSLMAFSPVKDVDVDEKDTENVKDEDRKEVLFDDPLLWNKKYSIGKEAIFESFYNKQIFLKTLYKLREIAIENNLIDGKVSLKVYYNEKNTNEQYSGSKDLLFLDVPRNLHFPFRTKPQKKYKQFIYYQKKLLKKKKLSDNTLLRLQTRLRKIRGVKRRKKNDTRLFVTRSKIAIQKANKLKKKKRKNIYYLLKNHIIQLRMMRWKILNHPLF